MAGDVRLKIDGDASGLLSAVKSAISQLQKEADKLKIAPTAKVTPPGGAAYQTYQQAFQASRAQEQKTRNEQVALQMTKRNLEDIGRQLANNARLEASSAKDQREKNFYATERNKLEREYQTLLSTRDRLQKNMGGGGASGGGMGPGGITSIQGLAKALGVPIAAMGIGATMVAGGMAAERARTYFSEANNRARTTEASAFQMQGQGGQRLGSILNGGASEEIMFNPQRMQANKIAEETMNNRLQSQFRIFSRPLETIFGRGSGHATGPGAGAYTVDQLGLGTDAQKREIAASQDRERAGIQAEQFEALKNGPEGALRTAVGNQYLQNYQRDLGFQRQMGLNNQSFRGEFLGGIQSAGFTTEQGMGMASGIMGAGGSTRAATGTAALGLQAQRNLDLTNSGSILGKLSGSMGSSGDTKEAFVKILAEGTRVGLDGSDFREENRKFVETAADVISKSGTTSGAGVEQILSQFGRFFGDRTGTGIEAGKSAFELYRQTSMATTGPRATMRAAGMLTDPTISGLSRDSRAALFNMPIDQLTSDNPAIVAMANEAKVTPQQLIDAQNKITSKSANLFKNSDVATRRLADIKKKYGMTSALDMMGPMPAGAKEEITNALGESNIAQIKEHPELGQNQRLASAYSDALSSGDTQRQSKVLEDAKKQQLSATTTGRPEDETNRAQAEASRLSTQLFMSIKDSITPASDAVKTFAADINTLVSAIKSGTPAGAAINAFNAKYPGVAPTTAPSAGAPSSGGGSGH